MKHLQHLVEYLLVRGLEAFLNTLSVSTADRVGEGIGLFFLRALSARRALMLRNLSAAFPEKPEREKRRIARAAWKNIGRTAVEFLRIDRMAREGLDRYVVWDGADRLEAALRQDRGVILLTAHFCNWELTGVFLQHRFGRMMAIFRHMRNPWISKWVLHKRTIAGMQLAPHRQAVKNALRWVKQKNIVGILVDQNLYTGGIFAQFFGRAAATTTFPALLHLRTSAPILLTYTLREPDGRFRLVVEPPILWPASKNPEDEVRLITQSINDRLEDLIRRHPDEWFWVHNRWKRQPEPSA